MAFVEESPDVRYHLTSADYYQPKPKAASYFKPEPANVYKPATALYLNKPEPVSYVNKPQPVPYYPYKTASYAEPVKHQTQEMPNSNPPIKDPFSQLKTDYAFAVPVPSTTTRSPPRKGLRDPYDPR